MYENTTTILILLTLIPGYILYTMIPSLSEVARRVRRARRGHGPREKGKEVEQMTEYEKLALGYLMEIRNELQIIRGRSSQCNVQSVEQPSSAGAPAKPAQTVATPSVAKPKPQPAPSDNGNHRCLLCGGEASLITWRDRNTGRARAEFKCEPCQKWVPRHAEKGGPK